MDKKVIKKYVSKSDFSHQICHQICNFDIFCITNLPLVHQYLVVKLNGSFVADGGHEVKHIESFH